MSSQGIVLRHGTTRRRAEAILKNGPDPNFREPAGGVIKAEGYSTATLQGPFPIGTPEMYAITKANNFPNEGGPAIVEIEVPQDIVDLADHDGGDVRFNPGWGLEELRAAWSTLPKRIVPC
jgi:hypothetical protein